MKPLLILTGLLLLAACTPAKNDFPARPTETPQVRGNTPPATPTGFVVFPPPVTRVPTTQSGLVPPNRDDPVLMVQTYFDLLKSGDTATARTWWRDPQANAADLAKVNALVAAGSIETHQIGDVRSNGAAGTIYFPVPIAMTVQPSTGQPQHYAVCLLLSRSNVPTGNTNPPYPITIRSAQVKQMAADGTTLMSLATNMALAGDC